MPDSLDEHLDEFAQWMRGNRVPAGARHGFELFVRSLRSGDGGACVMQAPCGRRDLIEIGYQTESWHRLAG